MCLHLLPPILIYGHAHIKRPNVIQRVCPVPPTEYHEPVAVQDCCMCTPGDWCLRVLREIHTRPTAQSGVENVEIIEIMVPRAPAKNKNFTIDEGCRVSAASFWNFACC